MDFIQYIRNLFGRSGNNSKLDDMKKEVSEIDVVTPIEKPTLPDGAKYDRLEYDAPDDDAIKARAEAELAEYAAKSKQAIDDDAAATKAKLEAERTNAETSIAEKTAAVDRAYDRADRETSNDVLKRGVARSSIAVNRMADLSKARAEEQAAVQKAYTDYVGAIDTELSGLEAKRQNALNAFNISLAAKLTEKINALTDERTKREQEVLKYNNSLTEKENAEARDKIMKESDLYSEKLGQTKSEHELSDKYGLTEEARNQAAYTKMRAALLRLSRAEARDAIRNDDFFQNNVSQYYYYKLYDEFGR